MITLQFNITNIHNTIHTTSPPSPTQSTVAQHQPIMATSDLPPKMRAWTLTSAGLTLSPSHPLPGSAPPTASSATTQSAPTITGNNLLLKITHAALNPVDLHILRLFPHWLPFRRNPTPGFDFCGRVVGAGPDVDANEFTVGDVVCGALGAGDVFWGKGSLAEYLLVSSSLVAKKPKTWGGLNGGNEVSGEEAVGLFGIAGQTAVLMAQTAGVSSDADWKGKRCLVNGASGGVGSILTQILKGKGAEVWGTTGSAEGEELVTQCGGKVVNYKDHHPVTAHLAELFGEDKLDFIFDCAGSQDMFSQSPGYLKKEGKFISIAGGPSQGVVPYVKNKLRPVWLGRTPREFELLLLIPGKKTVREVGRLVEEGFIERGLVDGGVWEMEELVKAYERLGSGRAKGKVVIRVGE
ncbi:NAD(P)-binding protein [Neurospora crassa]|nr:NAD(P)-binding protein [Neurospora crassa]